MTDLIISGIIDGPLTGGTPKAIELTALVNIADLSIYGLAGANNGGASDGAPELTLSGSLLAGETIYIASEATQFTAYFGFAPDFTSTVANINGDDAMELYKSGTVIDVFGVVGTDGTGQAWEHLDGWAYRNDGAAPNGGVFDLANWTFSGVDSLDGATSNATAANPFPVGTFTPGEGGGDDTGTGGGDDVFALISTIQGNAADQGTNVVGTTDNNDASPLRGQIVTVEAIVVGDFQNGDADTKRNLGGFFLQQADADADADLTTSEGIFVFDDAFGTDVNIGDRVRVTGTVTENFGSTQLSTITAVNVVSSGNPLPTAAVINLPAADTSRAQSGLYQADLEAFEGMLVTFEDTLTITEQFQLDRFNEVRLFATEDFEQAGPDGSTITGERPFQFTQYNDPDAAAYDAYLAATAARNVIYDDGLNLQNQSINNLDGFGPYVDATAPSMGDTIVGLTGVLDYSWAGHASSQATWRVRATEDGQNSFEDSNPRTDATAIVGGDLRIASFNVLNFFTTLDVFPDTPNDDVGPNLALEPRGADTSPQQALAGFTATSEFDRQLEKMITAILGLDAHIIGLNELENDFLSGGTAPGDQANQQGGLTAIETIVAALNDALGVDVWDWVNPGQEFVGTDAITVGMIYRTDMVQLATGTNPVILTDAGVDAALLAQSTEGAIFDGSSRAPLAATFETLDGGDLVTVAVNHFKSKGSGDSATGADIDAGNGAGSWNNQRLLAAQALDAWLGTNPTGSDTGNIMLLGDFNSYAEEAPIDYLTDVAGYVNLAGELIEAGYGYIFDAFLGTLDYAFASLDLFASIVDVLEWNINADEADALDYNLEFSRDPAIFDGSLPYRSSDHDPIVVGLTFADRPLVVTTYDGALYDASIDPTGALDVTHLSTLSLAGAEIATFADDKLFVTSANGLQIVDISDAANPVLLSTIDFTTLGFATTDITSVATNGTLIAVALPASPKTDNGQVVFLNLDGTLAGSADVGALPDMVTFTPDGMKVLVANEAEGDEGYLNNPDGSISVIDISGGMAAIVLDTITFDDGNGFENNLRGEGVRIFDGVATAADIEPEYIAVSADGTQAFVTLQENNAIAIIDLSDNTITDVIALGGKDFTNLLADFSDRDSATGGNAINLTTGNPVIGQFMPDAIASYVAGDGNTYYVIANEGDDRDDFLPVEETSRLEDLDLDDALFPNEAALLAEDALGRLTVVNAPLLNGDTDGDGDIDQVLTYGARSFSILDATGTMVFDSGDALERIIAAQFPTLWADGRSDNKGPEPEGVTVYLIGDHAFAFVGLERSNAVMVFDVTDPTDVTFVTGITNAGDFSPEGLLTIKAEDSPTGEAILLVANEVSNTLSLYQVAEPELPRELFPKLRVTEAWVGQDGTDLTADWFEITNTGDFNYVAAAHGALYYDDESADAAVADIINGVTFLAPGESAIVVIGDQADADAFVAVWGDNADLTGVTVGHTDGAGLGQGGDAVALWIGEPSVTNPPYDIAAISAVASGRSYDVALGAESAVGNASDATATTETAGTSGTEPAIASPGSVAPNFTLQLLHFSDAEAGLLAGDTAPLLAALVDGFDNTYANTLILAGGDNFLPGPFLAAGTDSSVGATHDKGTNPGAAEIEIHNRIGVEASTIGNHEFDLGTAAFSDAINDAAFPYLSSNLDFAGDSAISSRYQETVGVGGLENVTTLARKIVPSAVVTKGGETIGLVGATTQILEAISSTGNVEVEGFAGDGAETNDMALLAAQLQPVIDDLIAQGVTKVILMAHLQQIAFEQALAPLLRGVDIILSAGSNTRLGDDNDVAVAFPGHAADFANTYPIVTAGADGKTTLIVNTDNEFTYLGRLVLEFDAKGEIILDSLNETINGAYAATEQNVAEAWGDLDGDLSDTAFAEGTKGEQVADITEAVDAVIAAEDGQVWGFTNVYLEGERDQVRNQETNLGNITADANMGALKTAVADDSVFFASLKNGGGIRAQIGAVDVLSGAKTPPIANDDAGKPEGGISQLDIENALRFNNRLMALDTTPEGLRAILEHGVASLGNQGRFPQIGGISFSYDPDLAAGSRVQNIALIDEDGNFIAPVLVDGVISPDAPATITMVTLNFLANGGDSYPFKDNASNFRYLLNDGTLSAPVDEALSFTAAENVPANALGEQQALADYLQASFATAETAFDEADTAAGGDTRIQNLNVVAEDTVIPADVFTLELLHFTDQEASTGAIEAAPNLSAVLNALRGQDVGDDGIADNTLTLSSGDSFIPSPFFDASQALYGAKGIADIQIQNELGVQAVAFGNHEFDLGTGPLADLIDGSAGGDILGDDFQGALYPYLSSNLDFATNTDLAPLEVAGGGAPLRNTVTSSVVLTVDSAQTGQDELIGVVGATTPTLGRISSPDTVGILPTPFDNVPTGEQLVALAAIIQSEVDALLAANPTMNKVILLAHMQVINIEVQLASRLSNVDVIVAGGSNTRLFDDNDRPRTGDSDQGQYPIFATDKDGNPIAIVNTDGSYKYVGRLVVDFDENGHIIPTSYDADVSGAYATDNQGVADLDAEGLVDAEIQQIVDEVEAQIISTQSNIFGYSNVFLNGNRGASGNTVPGELDGVRTQETNLGNLTALANLAYAKQTDSSVMVSIKNGGGIRANIGETVVPPGGTVAERFANAELVDGDGNIIKPAGAISQNDIATALSFNNALALIDMTATDLVAALEHAVRSLPSSGGQ